MIPYLDVAGFPVGTHDLFSVLGIGVGLVIYYRALSTRHLLGREITVISLAVLAGGALGGRLLLAWDHLSYFGSTEGLPLTWVIEHSGKSLIGAIVGGYLAGVLAKRALGYRRSTGDCYALAIPVAVAIGRIGCFLSELPLGTPTTLPWGVSVPASAAASFDPCPGCDGPMHPAMLYEAAFSVLAAAAVVRFRSHVTIQGDLLKSYLLAAGIFRFFLEAVRANPQPALGLTAPQLVLIPLLVLLAVHFGRELRSGRLRVPAAPQPAPAELHLGGTP